MSSSLRSQPELSDPLTEILLRLPPQPSSSLPRAQESLASKLSRAIVSDIRRFRIGTPPLLGCYIEKFGSLSFIHTTDAPDRVPPGRLSLLFEYFHTFQPLGCRHGLALVSDLTRQLFLVWDPVTGDQHRVAAPWVLNPATTHRVNGAVLRAAGDVHFQLVIVATSDDGTQLRIRRRAMARVYSSETGLWGDLICTPRPLLEPDSAGSGVVVDPPEIPFDTTVSTDPAVLVRGSLYWKLTSSTSILEFDLEKQSLALIQIPTAGARARLAWDVCSVRLVGDLCKQKLLAWLHCPCSNPERDLPPDLFEDDNFTVIRADGGGLGILFLSNHTAQLWERNNTDCDGVASWVLGRTIQLDKLLSLDSKVQANIMVLAYAEENNMVFLRTPIGTFVVQLQSLKFKELPEFNLGVPYYPYESVDTADIGGEHDGGQICYYEPVRKLSPLETLLRSVKLNDNTWSSV